MSLYYRPLVSTDPARPEGALTLAGGWGWFTHVEVLSRVSPPMVIAAEGLPPDWRSRLTAPRPAIAGLRFRRPLVMGILNVTPDSFSDGGRFSEREQALAAGRKMVADGADILDVGGESTRPGAETIADAEEIARTAPVIESLVRQGLSAPVSIDTRKAGVARVALDAGAALVNDVSGFTFDPDLAQLCADRQVPVCVMHSRGDPSTMQQDPRYDDVLLDVFDALASRIDALARNGIPPGRIIADPGIGFGKSLGHNLALLQRIGLFHGLGVPVLLGASRKRFIGTISGVPQADRRMPGSIAVALAALEQGIQIVRVHDVAETVEAVALWRSVRSGKQVDG